jgi:hypothetical protein
LNYLRLSKQHWAANDPDEEVYRTWIFRGQINNNAWKLLPSAWREKCDDVRSKRSYDIQFIKPMVEGIIKKIGSSSDPTNPKPDSLAKMVFNARLEFEYVGKFIELCDRLGQHAPEFQSFRDRWTNFVEFYINNYLTGEHWKNDAIWTNSAVALAQHHGIPSRLLDWTYSPLAAAFFAASDALRKQDSKELVVYAVNLATLQAVDHEDDRKDEHYIKLVHVPRSQNTFLHAQQGLFTYDASGDTKYVKEGKYPGLEQSILRILNQRSITLSVSLAPKKLILPRKECEKLLRLLKLEGIWEPSLMPTYDNIARNVMESR